MHSAGVRRQVDVVVVNAGVDVAHGNRVRACHEVPRLGRVDVRVGGSAGLPGVVEVPHGRVEGIVRCEIDAVDEVRLRVEDVGNALVPRDSVGNA